VQNFKFRLLFSARLEKQCLILLTLCVGNDMHLPFSFCWSAELEEGGTFGPISGGNDNTALAGHVRVVENIGFVSVTMDYLCEGIHPRSQR
jgi:hypothetical protein